MFQCFILTRNHGLIKTTMTEGDAAADSRVERRSAEYAVGFRRRMSAYMAYRFIVGVRRGLKLFVVGVKGVFHYAENRD